MLRCDEERDQPVGALGGQSGDPGRVRTEYPRYIRTDAATAGDSRVDPVEVVAQERQRADTALTDRPADAEAQHVAPGMAGGEVLRRGRGGLRHAFECAGDAVADDHPPRCAEHEGSGGERFAPGDLGDPDHPVAALLKHANEAHHSVMVEVVQLGDRQGGARQGQRQGHVTGVPPRPGTP